MSEQFMKAVESVYTKTCPDIRAADKAEGKEEGIQEGIQKGVEKGHIEKAVTVIKKLLKLNNMSFEEILGVAGISKETYEQYKDVY